VFVKYKLRVWINALLKFSMVLPEYRMCQTCTQRKRLPAILRKDGPAPFPPFLRIEVTEDNLVVVLELERFEAAE
jgi:hypothetical protein